LTTLGHIQSLNGATTFLQKAELLVRHGLAVFPLAPMLKIPAIPKARGGNGVLDATKDMSIIAGWNLRYPKANIGAACGAISGIIVLDLDPKNGSAASVEALRAQGLLFPKTVCSRTPRGGWHLYFKWRPGLSNSVEAIAPGIDVRSERGYVAAPASFTRDGLYQWFVPFEEMQPAELPDWIPDLLAKKAAPEAPEPRPKRYNSAAAYNRETASVAHLFDLVETAKEGNRNALLFWAACRLAEKGRLSAAKKDLEAAAIRAGLEKSEVLKTIASAESTAGRAA
jgi:hypothetical protein